MSPEIKEYSFATHCRVHGPSCVILAVDRHSGYVVAVPGKKYKEKDKRDKHGVGLQAKTMAQAMMRHWLTVFDVPAVICSDRGTQFVDAWFRTMCKYMGVRHAKTVAYHCRSNGRVEVAGRQLFEEFRQLHIEEPGRNWYHSLRRVGGLTTIYPDRPVCPPKVSYSCGIQFHVLSRG